MNDNTKLPENYYNPASTCVKCGSRSASVKYFPPYVERLEHIGRKCDMCGYCWAERCLDA